MHNIGSFGIILNESNEILLCLRNDKNIWNLPGGKVEVRESPFKACIREVKEETGLTVKLKKLIGVYLYTSKNKLVFTFLCKAISGKLELNSEAKEIKYFSLNKIPENTLESHIIRINNFFNYPNKIFFVE